jgi:hypothetical protein
MSCRRSPIERDLAAFWLPFPTGHPESFIAMTKAHMNKAHMTLSSMPGSPANFTANSPMADVLQNTVTTKQWRRLVVRRRRERRGIILIFVVVLLMLLAIMGTAYLATSRADRTPIRGNGVVAGTTSPRLADRTELDEIFEATQKRVQNAIIEDLFNVKPGSLMTLQRDAEKPAASTVGLNARARLFSAFRQEGLPPDGTDTDFNRFFLNYDAPGRADPYLSSLLPTKLQAPFNPTPAIVTNTVATNTIVWPWIGAPLTGEVKPGMQIANFFADPRRLTNTVVNGFSEFYAAQPLDVDRATAADFARPIHNNSVMARENLPVEAVPLLRSDAVSTIEASKTTRVYPGLNALITPTPGAAFRRTVVAGDADGDGIADSGLAPIILNPGANGVNRYLDTANGVVYFVSYRVVDNSAKVNINTALTARSDFSFPTTATPATIASRIKAAAPLAPPAAGDQPNLGFSRSNVGLLELVRNTLEPLGGTGLADAEIDRLLAARVPSLAVTSTQETNPNTTNAAWARIGFDNDPANPSTPAAQVVAYYGEGIRNVFTPPTESPTTDWYYRFRSFGDSLEQTLARRPENVGALRPSAGGTLLGGALVSLQAADTVAFSAGGGSMLNEQLTKAVGENALLLSTSMLAPNFSTTPDGSWKWFPAGEIPLWFGWSKDFSLSLSPNAVATQDEATPGAYAIALLDGNNAFGTVQFAYAPPTSSGLSTINMGRSIRPLLTTRSGVTSLVPKRYDGSSVPVGMPDYGPLDDGYTKYPAEVVSASTGTKEQLWRAYWSVMTLNQPINNSASVIYKAEKQLQDPATTSTTGYFNYFSPEVVNDPYRKDYDAFLPPDRHYSIPDDRGLIPNGGRARGRLDAEQMTLIRSAIAACNTIDLRDNDNDITAMTIDLGATQQYNLTDPANPINSNSTAQRSKLYARIYGTEKQLVISSVVVDRGAGGTYVAVELFNPSDEPLKLDGYHLAVMNRGDSAAVSLADAYVYVDNPAGSATAINEALMSNGSNHAPTTDPTMILPPGSRGIAGGITLAPGGFVVIESDPGARPATVHPPVASNPALPTVPTPLTSNDVTTPDSVTPSQVIVGNPMPYLSQLASGDSTFRLNRELVLLRTRRADGIAYKDYDYTAGGTPAMEANSTYRRPTMNEDLTTVQGLSTLVPVDGVDCRSLDQLPAPTPAPSTARPAPATAPPAHYWYIRATTPFQRFTPDVDAWKCFYAGRTYEPRPLRISQKPPVLTTPTATYMPQIEPSSAPTTGTWAWQTSTAPPDITLGVYHPSTGTGLLVAPFAAPTIPIQNAKPYTQFDGVTAYNPTGTVPRTDMDHPPFQYPYGSPFARNGDILNVPFIGTYKIYRVQVDGANSTTGPNPTPAFRILPPGVVAIPGAANAPPPAAPNRALYEYVPITMDAVNVAPDQTEWTTVAGVPTYANPSVGRFDARDDLFPRNDWAADLFDYVVARKPASTETKTGGTELALPDIPKMEFVDRTVTPTPTPVGYNNPMVPPTDQDGPVLSVGDSQFAAGLNANITPRVPWIEWRLDAPAGPQKKAPASISRSAASPLAKVSAPTSKLIAGTINLNTADPIVLRMLPWTVNPLNGFLDQNPTLTTAADGSNAVQRQRTGVLAHALTSSDFDVTPPLTVADQIPIGRQLRPINKGPFGLRSVMTVSGLFKFGADDPRAIPFTDTTTVGVRDHAANQNLMRMGMLNPQQRSDNETDFHVTHLNMDRVSNLTSQRSDCFTVYVTVQAWTYVNTTANPNIQVTDTRLVGERRGSFVVDRSLISQTAYKPSDLIVYPVEQE